MKEVWQNAFVNLIWLLNTEIIQFNASCFSTFCDGNSMDIVPPKDWGDWPNGCHLMKCLGEFYEV